MLTRRCPFFCLLPIGPIVVKSVDPGVRTPFAVYSSDGCMLDIGHSGDCERLEKLCHRDDKLRSWRYQRSQPPPLPPEQGPQRLPYALGSKARRKLMISGRKTWYKIHNLVTDLLCRAANYLALRSDVIVMPRMEVHQMIKKRASRLSRKTKRSLKGWGHCTFVNRLAIKCLDIAQDPRYPEKVRATALLVQPEGYTSKT